MPYKILISACLLLSASFNCLTAQNQHPCSYEAVMLKNNPNRLQTEQHFIQTEQFIQHFIKNRHTQKQNVASTYVIPVVLHVFHNGNDGMISEDQARSSIEVLNADLKGLNDDFNDIPPRFDSIKATIDVEFCLATIDPQGNPTNGIIYYDNEQAMYNNINLYQFAWDNFSYLNIYLPKYATGGPSIYTAYASFPDIDRMNNNEDGIVHSSYRWGLGSMSELTTEDDRISIVTHEVGHWLNLFHTFENGCSPPGDYVDDTPPTVGGDPAPVGCNNFGLTCNVPTNGSNYMDYNLDCKKMFTEGQVERMTAALQLPERSPLWSEENLIETGCASAIVNCPDVEVGFTGLPATLPVSSSATLAGSPEGGTFSGPGVSFDVFNTSSLLPGLYTISYTYQESEGCSFVSSQSVIVYSVDFYFVEYNLGTIEPKAPQQVNIQLEVHQPQVYSIKFFDVDGKNIHQSKSYLDSGNYRKRFQLNTPLNKGMYFMNISSANYSVTRKWVQ